MRDGTPENDGVELSIQHHIVDEFAPAPQKPQIFDAFEWGADIDVGRIHAGCVSDILLRA
jgi:hypothetical protein